jgi:hypothetical protein
MKQQQQQGPGLISMLRRQHEAAADVQCIAAT